MMAMSAARLFARAPAHWGIENRLHYARDVARGEDQGRTHTAAASRVLPALRNAAFTLIPKRQRYSRNLSCDYLPHFDAVHRRSIT